MNRTASFSRRNFLKTLGLAAGALALPALAAAQAAAPRPRNILFILTEDQGNQLACLGTKGLKTPNMDALAQAGVLFENSFVNYPVCSPSKACIYTGLYPHTNGIRENTQNYFKPAAQLTDKERNDKIYQRLQVRPEIPTLLEIMHNAGYHIGLTSKLHVAPNEKFPVDYYSRAANEAAATRFIAEAAAADKPWFLMFNISHPHRPYRNGDKVKLTVDPAVVDPPPFLPATPVVRQDWAEYLDGIELADVQVGQAMAALKASGQAGQTLVLFMGDHGPCFQRGKMNLYGLGLRVPLIVEGPGIQQGVRSDALVSEIDLMPTILEYAGLPAPARQDGQSLMPLLEGKPGATGHEYIVGEIHHGSQTRDGGMQERTLFDGRYRLLYRENPDKPRDVNADLKFWKVWGNRSYDETVKHKDAFPQAYALLQQMDPQSLGGKPPRLELYDTRTDPWEMNNIAEDPAVRPERDRLLAALRDWAIRTNDEYIHPEQM